MTPATKAATRPRTTAARSGAARSTARRSTGRQNVRAHRRVSGPARPATARAASARAATAPLPVPPLSALSLRVLRAGRSLQDSTLLDRLVRGRGWIVVLGALLFGLVALNVSLLKLNAAAGHSAERAKILRIQNAKLRGKVSRLASGDRLRATAADRGFVMPEAKQLHYLEARPDRDPRQAVRNIRDGTAIAGEDDLVSATPQLDSELAAPTPPVPVPDTTAPAAVPPAQAPPTVATATGTTGTAGATGASGAAGTTGQQTAATGG